MLCDAFQPPARRLTCLCGSPGPFDRPVHPDGQPTITLCIAWHDFAGNNSFRACSNYLVRQLPPVRVHVVSALKVMAFNDFIRIGLPLGPIGSIGLMRDLVDLQRHEDF